MIRPLFFNYLFFPTLEKVTETKFWSIFKQSNRLQNDQLGQWEHLQLAKLQDLLNTASSTTPYWFNLKSQLPTLNSTECLNTLAASFSEIPITQKKTYQAGFPDHVTNLGDSNNYQYLSSSGTTGRMTVVTDFRKRDYLRAAEHLTLTQGLHRPLPPKTLDIPPNACNIVCGFADEGPENIFAYLMWALKQKKILSNEALSDIKGRFERQLILKRTIVPPINPGPWSEICSQIDPIIDTMMEEKTAVLRGLPQFLLWISVRAKQRKLIMPHLQAVLPYGGLAGDAMILRIQRNLGVPFINNYGTGEVGAIGCSLQHFDVNAANDVINVYPSMVYLEVLDDEDKPVTEGGWGKVVVTDLNNYAMPIIRYQVGDLAKVIKSNDHSCQQIRLLGRQQESFINRSGQQITARELQNTFLSNEKVLNFRLDQITDKIYKATIACEADFDPTHLKKSLNELIGPGATISIKQKPFLLPESSGKYLAFQSNVG